MHALRLRSRKLALGPVTAIAIAGAVTFTGLAVTQTASAGTNGQQIALCTSQTYQAKLSGPNQDGQASEVDWLGQLLSRDENGCFQLTGYWWKGNVTIRWSQTITNSDGTHTNVKVESVCSVPTSADSDFFPCSDENAVPVS